MHEELTVGPGPPLRVSSLPNPVRDRCLVRYGLPAAGKVRIVIYDASGRVVKVLVKGELRQGAHSHVLDVKRLPGGVYFLKLSLGDESVTHKLTVVK